MNALSQPFLSLRSIARALGGVVSGDKVLAPGPGHSKHDRSMAVWVDPNSPSHIRVHSFAGDDWKACMEFVVARLGTPVDFKRQPSVENVGLRPISTTSNDANKDKRSAMALEVWEEAMSIAGTPVATNLGSRNIKWLPDDHVVRYHDACPFRLDDGSSVRLPAMIALFRDIITDKPVAIHRTALKRDGSAKSDHPNLGNARKMWGPVKGSAIKLSPDDDVTLGLGIAEGIETALSILSANWAPVWALGSAGAIASFPVLAGIDCLSIFADADEPGMRAGDIHGVKI